MREQDLMVLRKRAFTYKRKQRLIALMQRTTNWNEPRTNVIIKSRRLLVLATSGIHRYNGDPASSHQQFIQTSLLLDGWTDDHLMSALAWGHDMKDDFRETYDYYVSKGLYSPELVRDIDRLSRNSDWKTLSFRDEIAESDRCIRSGGERTMVVKINDRRHNDLNPIKNTSGKRRRKSGMKVWQSVNSILPMAKDIGYKHKELTWLNNRQLQRLGYTAAELDKLVLRPLDNP